MDFLLFGAIVALALRTGPDQPVVRMSLFLATNTAFDIGIWLTWHAQHQIRRERLSIIASTMRLLQSAPDKRDARRRKREATRLLSHPLIAITVMSTILAGYVSALIAVVARGAP